MGIGVLGFGGFRANQDNQESNGKTKGDDMEATMLLSVQDLGFRGLGVEGFRAKL